MRQGHRGCPALNTPQTAWRALARGAPVTAEGGGAITTSERRDPTRVQLNHTPLADRTHQQWTTDTNPTMDPAAQLGTPPSQDVCSRDGGIRLLPSGSDRSTAVCNHDGRRNDLRRFHRYPYDMRILRGRDQTKWQGQKSMHPRPRIPRHPPTTHAPNA